MTFLLGSLQIGIQLAGLSFASLCYGMEIGGAIVGSNELYVPQIVDNIWTVADKFAVSGLRLLAANPRVSVDLGETASPLIIPKMHIVPNLTSRLSVDVSRRLLFLRDPKAKGGWRTFEASIGTAGQETPTGHFFIKNKKHNPAWYPTSRQRSRDADLPAVVPPGQSNPLGPFALYLSKPSYLIHGTRDDWQVGTAETDGCIELRNKDAETLQGILHIGDAVTIVHSSPMVTVVEGTVYLEVGPYFSQNSVTRLMPIQAKSKSIEFLSLVDALGSRSNARKIEIDHSLVEDAFRLGLGYPTVIGHVVSDRGARVR